MNKQKILCFGLATLLLAIGALAVSPTNMVFVEGGTFTMGDTWGNGRESARPVHSVTLDAFEMSICEITQSEMAQVMNWAYENEKIVVRKKAVRSNEREPEDLFPSENLGWAEESFEPEEVDLPAHQVSWYGAAAYCNYRSEMEGLKSCYKMKGSERWQCNREANGYRLPTEAEWEYAARGGALGRNTKYSGSDILDEVGWGRKTEVRQHGAFEGVGTRYAGTGPVLVSKMQVVGQKTCNELEFYDMSGNVWEWCNDWYGDYEDGSQTNPAGSGNPNKKKTRVIRGGSYGSMGEGSCRVDFRGLSTSAKWDWSIGFRVVRSVLSEEE